MSIPVITILGMGDAKTRLLREHVATALALYPISSQVINVSEPNQILQAGVSSAPALLLDGKVVTEGEVPTVSDITRLLKRRYLYRSKLYRLKHILAPLDYSLAADNAFRYACRLAMPLGAQVEALHIRPTLLGHLASARSTDEYAREWHELNQHIENLVPVHLAAPAPQVTVSLRSGVPATELIQASEDADLIVMGAVGKKGWVERVLGGVSTTVSHEAHCPVLFVPPHARFQGIKNILYAANYDSLNAEKIQQLVSFADRFGAQIHFVHIGSHTGDALEKRLFEISHRHAEPAHSFRFTCLESDDVLGALDEYAISQEIDLTVFITERRDRWHALLHQSVSRRALLDAHTPLLVCHLNNDMVY